MSGELEKTFDHKDVMDPTTNNLLGYAGVLLIHLLRWFERQTLLEKIAKIVFIVDGPLAIFGHPAWLSPIIKKELKRLNAVVRAKTGTDILIVGIEKTGSFVTHFDEIDQTKTGELRLERSIHDLVRTLCCPEDVTDAACPWTCARLHASCRGSTNDWERSGARTSRQRAKKSWRFRISELDR